MNKLIQRSFLNVLATVAYIAIVGTLLRNANKIFGPTDNFVTPVAAITLFVFSAAITGSLILGKPILMYLNNEKTEAVKLFIYTMGWLGIATIILFATMVVIK